MRNPTYFGDYAALAPDKPAVIHGVTGVALTYRELDERSNRLAQYLYALGLRRGDHIAVLMENNMRYFELCWAALRSGLVLTTVNRFLTAGEAAYIVEDCGAQVVVSSYAVRELADQLTERIPTRAVRLMVDGTIAGWSGYEKVIARFSPERLAEEWLGTFMLYTSGTTGRPKGVVRSHPDCKITEDIALTARSVMLRHYGFTSESVYLSTAPLYHTAPLNYAISTQFYGGIVVLMPKFDAFEALSLIERYRVTHSQWVPTMFIRMLKLQPHERHRFDLSSHKVAIHAAAPCPVEVKRQMIEWWGPILQEYYGGSEGNGLTAIDSHEWLTHPGSVGREKQGVLHICGDDGMELPVGEQGVIYFANDHAAFHYYKDPEKTRAAQHPHRPTWTTIGDIGYVNAEGYLYLTGRQSFMIISGGVNIYPQAIEDALVMHPSVGDAAVIGVPNAEMGEEVKAIIELTAGVAPCSALAEELLAFLSDRVARYMLPRSIDFIDVMPRLATGKLYKQALRERYCNPQ